MASMLQAGTAPWCHAITPAAASGPTGRTSSATCGERRGVADELLTLQRMQQPKAPEKLPGVAKPTDAFCEYAAECHLLAIAAELLRLPFPVPETALVLLHRYSRSKQSKLSSDDVLACIFLASKIEEAPVRTNDLLNAVQYLLKCQQQDADSASPIGLFFSNQPALQSLHQQQQQQQRRDSPQWVLVGEDYYSKKQTLVDNEQLLLRHIQFNLLVDHPHRYLFNFARLLGCQNKLVQLALCIVNDSLRLTQLAVDESAADIAGAALHISSLLLGQAQELPYKDCSSWWDALGLELEHLEDIGSVLLAVLRQSQA